MVWSLQVSNINQLNLYYDIYLMVLLPTNSHIQCLEYTSSNMSTFLILEWNIYFDILGGIK